MVYGRLLQEWRRWAHINNPKWKAVCAGQTLPSSLKIFTFSRIWNGKRYFSIVSFLRKAKQIFPYENGLKIEKDFKCILGSRNNSREGSMERGGAFWIRYNAIEKIIRMPGLFYLLLIHYPCVDDYPTGIAQVSKLGHKNKSYSKLRIFVQRLSRRHGSRRWRFQYWL